MLSNTTEQQNPVSIKLASALLKKVLPKYSQDALVGDLKEEFFQRKTQSTAGANVWLSRQVLVSLFYAAKRALQSTGLLKIVFLMSCLILGPTLIAMVAWLSNMDETSEAVWQQLLSANMHNIVTYGHFWQQVPEALVGIDHISMFIHNGSVAWSALSLMVIGALMFFRRIHAHQVALLGGLAMLLPYVACWAYINTMMLPPTKIGPIIAFMLFNIMYMLLPLTLMVIKASKSKDLLLEMD